MQLNYDQVLHLSYCANIHSGNSWDEIFNKLKQYLPELKNRLSPNQPFGIGLRLSANAAYELNQLSKLDEFKNWLKNQGLYVFTINGFVFGNFHGDRVKDEVYKPDWSTVDRYSYTSDMIEILTSIIDTNGEGSISTSPITYKYWSRSQHELDLLLETSCIQISKLAHKMALIFEKEHKLIHLDIEPEPDCFLENSTETISFFQKYLLPVGIKFLKENFQYSDVEAEDIIKTHIRVCFDTCHFALEYENPVKALSDFQKAGIRIGKVQLSSALKVSFDNYNSDRSEAENQLRQFVEPVYLHQVLAKKKDGKLLQYTDLDIALVDINNQDVQEWRVHFHVPVFIQKYGILTSTQDEMIESLNYILKQNLSNHFEIETYTWEILPDELKMSLTDSIEREINWAVVEINKFFNN